MGLTRPRLGQLQTTTSAFDDPIVVFNNNASGTNAKDIGIVFERGDDQNKVLLWDESADEFVLANSTEQGSTSGDVTLASYAGLQVGTLKSSSFVLNGTTISATATELNLLDGVTGLTLGDENEILIVGTGGTSITSTDVLSIDDANNYIGINQTSPAVTLHMTGEASQSAQIRMEQHHDGADAPDIRTRKSRGTAAAPTKNNAGDYIYRQNHERYNGTGWTTVGQVAVDTDDTNADRFVMTFAVSEDGTSIDAADNQLQIDGADSGAITFNQAYKFPTSDGTNGQVLQTDGSGTLTFASVAGGGSGDVVDDTTPQLGGDLDVNGQTITSASNGNVIITPHGTGNIGMFGTPAIDGVHIVGSQEFRVGSHFDTDDRDFVSLTANGTNSDIRANNNKMRFFNDQGDIEFYTNGTPGTDNLRVTIASNGDMTVEEDLTVSNDLTVGGSLTLSGADITFSDNAGTFPTDSGGFYWDLNNDEARMYAEQPSSDAINFYFKLSDNNNSSDRYIFWIDDYRGQSHDRFPLTMFGNNLYFNCTYDDEGTPDYSTAGARIVGSQMSIGTNSPTSGTKLHLHDTNVDLEFALNHDSNQSARILSYDRGTSTESGLEIRGDHIHLNTDGTDRVQITDSTTTVTNALSCSSTISATGNISTSGVFSGTATSARYADLAEKYMPDSDYQPGTVLQFGGEQEVTIANEYATHRVAGVVSTDPAYIMNSALEGGVYIALQGRVPCRVIGTCEKGDLMVTSDINGCAVAWTESFSPPYGSVIGKALENKQDDNESVIEVVVGVR